MYDAAHDGLYIDVRRNLTQGMFVLMLSIVRTSSTGCISFFLTSESWQRLPQYFRDRIAQITLLSSTDKGDIIDLSHIVKDCPQPFKPIVWTLVMNDELNTFTGGDDLGERIKIFLKKLSHILIFLFLFFSKCLVSTFCLNFFSSILIFQKVRNAKMRLKHARD